MFSPVLSVDLLEGVSSLPWMGSLAGVELLWSKNTAPVWDKNWQHSFCYPDFLLQCLSGISLTCKLKMQI